MLRNEVKIIDFHVSRLRILLTSVVTSKECLFFPSALLSAFVKIFMHKKAVIFKDLLKTKKKNLGTKPA